MPQPDTSNSSRSLVFIAFAALVVVLAAAFGFFSGSRLGMLGGVLALLALVPLGLLYLSIRSGVDEAAVARLTVESQRRELLESRLMEVQGRLQREGLVIHVVAERLFDRSALLGRLEVASRDFH